MKRIEKGPVRGISLKLQEMVRLFTNFTFLNLINLQNLGKRKKDGFHPRKVRNRYCQHRGQEGRQRPHQGTWHQEARRLLQTRQAEQEIQTLSTNLTKLRPAISIQVRLIPNSMLN